MGRRILYGLRTAWDLEGIRKREVLFRGKRVDNDEWIEFTFSRLNIRRNYVFDITDITISIWARIIQSCEEVVNYQTIGQFTGLTDKNSRKIFEGDIYEYNNMCWAIKLGKFYDTEVKENFYGWFCTNGNGECFGLTGRELAYINIIGNIHDNPELLEQED